MKTSDLILLVIVTFTFLSNNCAELSTQATYTEFKKDAVYWGSSTMVKELNRVVNHLKIIHGDEFTPENFDLSQLINEMKSKNYVDPNVYIDDTRDPVIWKSGKIYSIAYQNSTSNKINKNNPYPFEHLYRAMNHENDPYVKLFALHKLRSHKVSSKVIDAIIKALMSERDEQILRQFVNFLKSDLVYKSLPINLNELSPELFKIRIKRMSNDAQNLEQKSIALFLNLLFSRYLPPLNTSTVMYCMDQNFPEDFLIKVFTKYPQTYLEEFIIPFKKGYGNNFLTLLNTFENFASNKKILEALKHALINRNKGHFSFYQTEILNTWSQITKTTYEGSDSVYLEWYKQQLKHN